MAQTIRYHNEGSTDMSLAASWRTRTFGASSAPIVSNVVYFAGGSDRITGGTTLNVALAFVSVTPAFRGTIGANGTPATIAVATNGGSAYPGHIFYYGAGGGAAYVTAGTAGIGIVKVDSMGGKLYLTGGTINTRIDVSRGELDVNDQVDLSGKTVNIMGGNVIIDYKADGTDPTVNVYGGNVLLKRASGTLTVNGGNVTVAVEKEQNAAAALVLNGGIVRWMAGDVATTMTLIGGALDCSQAVVPIDFSAATFTIGDTDVKPSAPGVKIKWPDPTTAGIVGAAPSYFRKAATNDSV